MKNHLLCVVAFLLAFTSYSQITFEKGYFIDNSDQRVECLIRNVDWNNNPTGFEYKLSADSEAVRATIESVKEFAITEGAKFKRATVKLDRSSEEFSSMSEDRNPLFEDAQVFLKVLVDGKAELYYYVESNLQRFFYSVDNKGIQPLIYKKYKISRRKIGENNQFRNQLWNDLNCAGITKSRIENLHYNKTNLISLFSDYNECNNAEFTNYEKKQERDQFNLSIRPRINQSSLDVKDPNGKRFGYDTEYSFGFGVDLEYILPFNRNKWAISVEPSFQSYRTEKKWEKDYIYYINSYYAAAEYRSIETPNWDSPLFFPQ